MEQQVVAWVKGWFDFPSSAGAVFVTGSSQANFMVCLLTPMYIFDFSHRLLNVK
jgi:glutamate/tyrosine decarboxylase-like PLP-dependent enzyme